LTGPPIVPRTLARILRLGEAGTEPLLPQSAAAPVGAVDVLHVALSPVLHAEHHAVSLLGSQQQVTGLVILLGPLGQPVQVEPGVLLGVEAYGAVVAALNEVPGMLGRPRKVS
jgi:hypothetical protein